MSLTECQDTSICHSERGGEGLAREKKVIFVLELLGAVLSVHFYRFHRKTIKGVETKVTGEHPLVP